MSISTEHRGLNHLPEDHIVRRHENSFRVIADLAFGHGLKLGMMSGAAIELASHHAGQEPHRLTADVDVIVDDSDIHKIPQIYPQATAVTKYDSVIYEVGGVELMGNMNIRRADREPVPFRLTKLAMGRVVVMQCGEVEVPVLDLADTIILKILLGRGPEVGKHDLADIRHALSIAEIDTAYMLERAKEMGVYDEIEAAITQNYSLVA